MEKFCHLENDFVKDSYCLHCKGCDEEQKKEDNDVIETLSNGIDVILNIIGDVIDDFDFDFDFNL